MQRTNTASRESRALTGLRGVAAMLVLLHHVYLHLGVERHLPVLEPMLRRGYLGVDLFFVLSGFVISMAYGGWFDGSGPRWFTNYLRFLARRVARLWPLHATLVLMLIAAGIPSEPREITPALVAANLLMIQNWDISATINAPAWSVSTELLAYVLFPLLASLVLRGRTGPAIALLCVVAALAACLHFARPIGFARRGALDIYFNYSPLPALRCLAGFITGMLAWRAGHNALVNQAASSAWTGPLALATTIAWMIGRVPDVVIYPLLPVIVLGMHRGWGPVHRAFATGPLYRLGVLSYAIYLIHFTLLTQFPFGVAPLPEVFAGYIALSLGLAVAAHHLIELPGRRLLRTWGDRALGGVPQEHAGR